VPEPKPPPGCRWDTELLVLRGDDRAGLRNSVLDVAEHLRQHPETDLTNLAFPFNTELAPGGCRLALIADSVAALHTRLVRAGERLADPGCRQIRDGVGIYHFEEPLHPAGKVACLFPGEGAPYPDMLGDVSRAFPEVAAVFRECDAALGRPLSRLFLLPEGAGAEERARAEQQLRRLDNTMLTVLMADWALYQLLGRLGLTADFTAGHSMGEVAALAVAGAIEPDERFLGRLRQALEEMQRQEESAETETVLLAVGAGRAAVAELLAALGNPPVYAAMDNCPHQTVVVGPPGPMRP
jgi:acyl transferase domain-containing protein